nr:GXWXG domain-containing protein [Ensifer adhaerens]
MRARPHRGSHARRPVARVGDSYGHPLDGVLENIGRFGKHFHANMRADALLFEAGTDTLFP